MSIFPKVTPALKPKSKESQQIAIFYAIILVIMAVAQLYTFEEFIVLVPSFNLPVGDALAAAIAPLIVTAEVFALPFLLRMAVSPAFRWFSMFLGWLVAALWLLITTWVVGTHQLVETVGFIGTVVDLMPGWWAVCISLSFAVLAAWASWGLWPAKLVLPARKVKKQL